MLDPTASTRPRRPAAASGRSREREVMQLLAEGLTNKMIAQQLGISVYTVDDHRGRVMAKLNLHSIGELVRFAMRKGIVD